MEARSFLLLVCAALAFYAINACGPTPAPKESTPSDKPKIEASAEPTKEPRKESTKEPIPRESPAPREPASGREPPAPDEVPQTPDASSPEPKPEGQAPDIQPDPCVADPKSCEDDQPPKPPTSGRGQKTIPELCTDNSLNCYDVKVIYLIPNEQKLIPGAVHAIERAVYEIQEFYRRELGGRTFSVASVGSNAIVQAIKTTKDSAWMKAPHASTGSDRITHPGKRIDANVRYLVFNSPTGFNGEGPQPYKKTRIFLVINGIVGKFGYGGYRMAHVASATLKHLMSPGHRAQAVARMAHELGHALGLKHSKDSASCKNSSFQSDGLMAYGWTKGLAKTYLHPFEKALLLGFSPLLACNHLNVVATPGPLYFRSTTHNGLAQRYHRIWKATAERTSVLKTFAKGVPHASACAYLCDVDTRCRAFAFNHLKECRLSSNGATKTSTLTTDSVYFRRGHYLATFHDQRLVAGTPSTTHAKLTSASSCSSLCRKNAGSCKAFSYTPATEACALFNDNALQPTAAKDVVSGVMCTPDTALCGAGCRALLTDPEHCGRCHRRSPTGVCYGGRWNPAIHAGAEQSCALLQNGKVKCWGDNSKGQLGYGDTTQRNKPDPAPIFLGSTTTQVAMGKSFVCALLDTGKVKCWGSNGAGQLGYGDAVDRNKPDPKPIDLGKDRTAKQIAAGGDFACALLDDNTAKCWGENHFGQLGYGDAVDRNKPDPKPIDLGEGLTALQLAHPSPILRSICALLSDNSVKCWGYNFHGNLGYGDTVKRNKPDPKPIDLLDAKQISIGGSHTCVRLGEDKVACWGRNSEGQLGYGDTTSRNKPDPKPIDLGAGRTAKQISVGTHHTCALLDDDTVKCWGDNSKGQLGYGDTTARNKPDPKPVDLGAGRTAKQISVGTHHTCALLDDNTFKCWGDNSKGQLGYGDTLSRNKPDPKPISFK